MRKGWRLNVESIEHPSHWLYVRFRDARRTKERGNPGRSYQMLKVLSGETELTPREQIEILLPMAVCLRLLGRPYAASMLFRQLLLLLEAVEGETEKLRLRIILDWSAALLDRGKARQAIVNLEAEFAELSESDELYWKTMLYLGRAYIRMGDAKGLDYITEAIAHLQGALRDDAERWKLEAKAKMWRGGRQKRREHYEELYGRFRQKAPVLALYAVVCYYTTFRLLRLMGILQGAVYVLKSMRPA